MQSPRAIIEIIKKNLTALNDVSYPSSNLDSSSALLWPHIQNIKKIKNKEITKNKNANNEINISIEKLCNSHL